MDIKSYFEMLKYILMASTFITLVLIFLYMLLNKEEEKP
jgi:hypothetical protein